MITLAVVDLPPPLGPTRAICSPAPTLMLSPSRAFLSEPVYENETLLSSIELSAGVFGELLSGSGLRSIMLCILSRLSATSILFSPA